MGEKFGNEPGKATYLKISDNDDIFLPKDDIGKSKFVQEIINEKKEDIVVFIHGYNSDDNQALARHRQLKQGLLAQGFKGDVITFAWPSDNKTLLYLEDRHDAKNSAFELVNSGIKLLARQQNNNCTINISIIAHSTGAYVVNEAFNDARTTKDTADNNWVVSQILFIGGDISSDSMNTKDGEVIYQHCNRLTNYYNPYDSILSISNAKRLGFKARVGRVGLPDDSPTKGVDVNCGNHYNEHKQKYEAIVKGAPSHSWYLYSDIWYKDAVMTIMGELDRNVIPTRTLDSNNELSLNLNQ
jgi:hypothetical protein